MEFIAEAFNLANRTNLTGPSRGLYNYSANAAYTTSSGEAARGERLQVNPSFGLPSGADSAREVQFALRFTF